ncbi:MAG: hypothetical protein ACLF0P_03130 [Thermoanaerobaculia bacterium]
MRQDDDSVKARKRLRFAAFLASAVTSVALVIGYLGAVEAIGVGGPRAPSLGEALFGPLLGALGTAYVLWGCYWGIPVVWRGWKSLLSSVGQAGCVLLVNPATMLFLVLLFFYVPLVAGYFYGVLGGGVYEYWKCRRRALPA